MFDCKRGGQVRVLKISMGKLMDILLLLFYKVDYAGNWREENDFCFEQSEFRK